MKNKKVIFIILFVLLICTISILLAISNKTNNTFDDYTEYVEEPGMDTMFNEDLIPDYEKNVVEVYLIGHKSELIEKGVPEEFFDSIEITMHNDSVYTIVAGDKVISIGLTEDGEVEYCNVF